MKNYDKNIYGKKFLSYKRAFLFFFIVFTLAVILGTALEKRGLLSPFFDSITPAILKNGGWYSEDLLLFIMLFLAGATIYAPTLSVIVLSLSGLTLVKGLSGLTLYPFLLELISRLFTAYFLISYASFVTLTALRIFTDDGIKNKTDLFTGTLFSARGFRGIFNFRYIGSYILFFIIFTLPTLGVTTLKEYLLL